jgi:hypothetical protein
VSRAFVKDMDGEGAAVGDEVQFRGNMAVVSMIE